MGAKHYNFKAPERLVVRPRLESNAIPHAIQESQVVAAVVVRWKSMSKRDTYYNGKG